MYRSAKYYAARTAAIKEALEQERAQVSVSRKKPAAMPAPYSAESLRDCGRSVPLVLGPFFGDLSGTVLEGRFCYALSPWVFLASFELDGRTHIVECFYYQKRDDIYNFVYSEEAVF